MGQRLVVTIRNSDKNLANAYYHWSGYTGSALEISKQILEKYDEIKEQGELEKYDEVDIAIELLESTGARMDDDEVDAWNTKRFHKMLKDEKESRVREKTEVDRNDGLLSVSESGIESSLNWSEGDVFIELNEEEIVFKCLNWYGALEDLNADYCASYVENNFVNLEYDRDILEGISFDDFPEIANQIEEAGSFFKNSGNYFCKIE